MQYNVIPYFLLNFEFLVTNMYMYCNGLISVLIFLANNVAFPNWQTYIFFQYILKMMNLKQMLNLKKNEFNDQDLEKTLRRGPHAIMIT